MMHYTVNGKILDFSKIQVMGILNFTPDSFFDGGRYFSLSKAIDHVANMIRSGADFIDIGGESTRPGAVEVSEDEEVCRVVPLVSEISKRFDVCISVNTSKSLIMRESVAVGAHLINDIRSLSEPGAVEVLLSYPQVLICLMHMQGSPHIMQRSPCYRNVVQEVKYFFSKMIKRCESYGINRNRLLIDPGFGFGKTIVHNYQLLAHLMDFHDFGLPLMVGMSRKSMLDISGSCPVDKRLIGSIASVVIAAMQGIQILRVHDVKETVEALQIVRAMMHEKENFVYGT